jgi:hypothetical protein
MARSRTPIARTETWLMAEDDELDEVGHLGCSASTLDLAVVRSVLGPTLGGC